MQQIIAWFGWGYGIGALSGISAILTVAAILAPVVVGLLLFALERLQVAVLKGINYDFAYFFVNFLTFPGTFVHEMAHLCFAVITGAEVHEICMFENEDGRLGHISYSVRGPWFMRAVQHSLTAVAPTIVGLVLGVVLLRVIFAGGLSLWASIGLWYLVISLVDHSTMSDIDLEHYFQGVWIFIVPLFAFFFVVGRMA
jgi:hypothetical protein